jgi:hypothetical protein
MFLIGIESLRCTLRTQRARVCSKKKYPEAIIIIMQSGEVSNKYAGYIPSRVNITTVVVFEQWETWYVYQSTTIVFII